MNAPPLPNIGATRYFDWWTFRKTESNAINLYKGVRILFYVANWLKISKQSPPSQAARERQCYHANTASLHVSKPRPLYNWFTKAFLH